MEWESKYIKGLQAEKILPEKRNTGDKEEKCGDVFPRSTQVMQKQHLWVDLRGRQKGEIGENTEMERMDKGVKEKANNVGIKCNTEF